MIDFTALANRVAAGQIKALSIKQPYPHHIFYDDKDVENRNWPTKGRDWFIVHAGVSKSELDMDDPKEATLPRGGIVGLARIIDCVAKMDSPWFFGPFGFVLKDAFPVDFIACRGRLGFFMPEQAALDALAASLRAREEGRPHA